MRLLFARLYNSIFFTIFFTIFCILVVFFFFILSQGIKGFFYYYVLVTHQNLFVFENDNMKRDFFYYSDIETIYRDHPLLGNADQYFKKRKRIMTQEYVSVLYNDNNQITISDSDQYKISDTSKSYFLIHNKTLYIFNDSNKLLPIMYYKSSFDDKKESVLYSFQSDSVIDYSIEEVGYMEFLFTYNSIKIRFNTNFFLGSDSFFEYQSGILGAVIGSFYILTIAIFFATLLGVCSAIVSHEFYRYSKVNIFLRSLITNLTSCPSILFGLFGYYVFLHVMGLERGSATVCGLVLAFMAMPIIFTLVYDAVSQFPQYVRSSIYALGAGHRHVIDGILVSIFPKILNAILIALIRIAGETAPLIIVGGRSFLSKISFNESDPLVSIPSLIFLWSKRSTESFQSISFSLVIVTFLIFSVLSFFIILLQDKNDRFRGF